MWCMFFLGHHIKFTLSFINEYVEVSIENINVLLYLCNKEYI